MSSTAAITVAEAAPETTAPRRVLIVLLGAIGDVVRALALLGRIRRAWPDAHLAWAVEPKSSAILEGHPWLDELIIYDRRRAPWGFVSFLLEVRSRGFDLVLDLQRHLKSGVTSWVSGAADRWGFAAANTKEFNHLFSNHRIEPQPRMRLKLLQYQAFGDALGIPAAPVEFGLEPSIDERARAREMLADAPRPLIGVILGSSWPSRIYFPESIAAVISGVRSSSDGCTPLFPVLLGASSETPLADAVISHLGGAPALNLAGRTGLRDLAAIFAECAVAFGPDCGPMHIAGAVGCPIVSLWGSTAAERSAPWGYQDFALTGDIPCHPCYLRDCPIGRECMRRIAPQDVIAAIRRAEHGRAISAPPIADGSDAQRTASR
ncbi:MAG TPA: glycosyltransferase family 9 protein [Candidatus Binataceae bacterium]|nr:glycosyltransferase family 9 protein [Candidatus Binataceae bacterium]